MTSGCFYGQPPPWVPEFARQHVHDYGDFHGNMHKIVRPITLGLPCVGIAGCVHSFNDIGCPFMVKWGFDTDVRIIEALDIKQDDLNALQIGKDVGDILGLDRAALHNLPDVDAIIAGPPCPPWAGMGSKMAGDDPRAKVFLQSIEMVLSQISKGSLKFFVLER